MDTSEHGVLSLCQVFGERAAPLPTASHKTDVVASVLPAPSVRGYVTYKQLAQATKLVLNKTMSGYPSAHIRILINRMLFQQQQLNIPVIAFSLVSHIIPPIPSSKDFLLAE